MIKPWFRLLSPSGPRARLSILIFHRVLPQRDPLFPGEVDAARFDAICAWIKGWFNVLPLDAAARLLKDGCLPERALSITFDDGYADNHNFALPILLRHGLNATFFVATGFLDGGRMWNDTIIEAVRRTPLPRLDLRGVADLDAAECDLSSIAGKQRTIRHILGRAKYLPFDERQVVTDAIAARGQAVLPDDLMMSRDQVRSLRRAGMQIGAHTVSHPILARLHASEARREIESGKRDLEVLLGEPVRLFAYPNGKPDQDYTPESVALARHAGFDAAVSTAWGAASQSSDCFQLPRFTPWDTSRLRFAVRLGRNLRLPSPA